MSSMKLQSRRSKVMASVRSHGTTPEIAVRRLLRKLGYRYSCNASQLPVRPDIVFPRLHKVELVHGCFWHRHDGCKKASLPRTNRRFWLKQLKQNVERDVEQRSALRKAGWKSLVVWECQTRDVHKIEGPILHFLRT